jgi:hypothetical protein
MMRRVLLSLDMLLLGARVVPWAMSPAGLSL